MSEGVTWFLYIMGVEAIAAIIGGAVTYFSERKEQGE